jgi:hypothetical protein
MTEHVFAGGRDMFTEKGFSANSLLTEKNTTNLGDCFLFESQLTDLFSGLLTTF